MAISGRTVALSIPRPRSEARMAIVSFAVLGRPQPQGSIRAFMVKGKPRLTSDNEKMRPWRQQVGWSALEARAGAEMALEGVPVRVQATFYLAKPKSAKKAVLEPCKKPDLDKLCRALLDALKGILYADDSQVTTITASKRFGLPERTEIVVDML